MNVYVKRSIGLSERSREAWQSVDGCVLLARGDRRRAVQMSGATSADSILYLGLSDTVNAPCVVWNKADTIRRTIEPAALRETMSDLLPAFTRVGPLWLKYAGERGRNKTFYPNGYDGLIHRGGDLQMHVVGQEWRVLSVGPRIVQSFTKTGTAGAFTFRWVNPNELPRRFATTIAAGIAALGDERTVFGWDIIDDGDRAYVIETNSSPGMSAPTAGRIVRAIRGE